MKIDVWYDVVCPWCWLGKARLDLALADRPDIEVRTHAFELNTRQPVDLDVSSTEHVAKKYGMPRAKVDAMHERMVVMGREVGIDFQFDRVRTSNTFDAHQLVHLARNVGGEREANSMVDRLFHAHFHEGRRIGSREVLVTLAREVGVEGASDALEAQTYADAVRADERTAHQMGVGGVPFFLFDGRLAVEGAQSVEVLREAIERAS